MTPGRDRELFIVATREIRKKNFDVGRLLFQTIITTYPDSPYLPMSKLAVADSFFLEGSTSSSDTGDRGISGLADIFPDPPAGRSRCAEDRRVRNAADRAAGQGCDACKTCRNATEGTAAELSEFVPRARLQKRLEQVQDNLGLHNLLIANYYYTQSVQQKKGGFKGAQSRYREIIDKYPNFSFADEGLL